MPTILITGGTGLVGKALTHLLMQKGYEVIILSRHPKKSTQPNLSYAEWNVEDKTIEREAVSRADFVIHLAGAGVADKRWTTSRKKEIIDSRTKSSALLVKALKEIPNKIKAVISASAIGWYGADERLLTGKRGFTEDMPADKEFLGQTCKLWEASINPVEELGKRLVKYRIGIVLSKDGGALKEFMKPVKFGIATVLGSGKQVISWIHIEDLCRLFLFAIENETLHGVYNAVAPFTVINHELIIDLAKKLKGRFYIPTQVPAAVLKLVLGEMSTEVLKSATVSSDKIRNAGFSFMYPSVEAALGALL